MIQLRPSRQNRQAELQFEQLVRSQNSMVIQALNKSLAWSRTRIVRNLASRLSVPQKVLRKRVQRFKARRRSRGISGSIWIGLRKPISARELAGNLTTSASGYVKIGRRIFKQAFAATMPGGHTGVFVRKPGAKHRKRPDGQMTQLPIEEGVAPLMPDAREVGDHWAREGYAKQFPRELQRLNELRLRRMRARHG